MALSQNSVRNRLLAALPADDFSSLAHMFEPVSLALGQVLVEARKPIRYVYFPVDGFVSTVAEMENGRIETGLVGYEGVVSTTVILGADRSPHTSLVQGAGSALRVEAEAFRSTLRECPSLFRPFGLYVQAFITQMAQTIYANAAFGIEARLARWILMAHDRTRGDELQLTHEFLAIMLGVRRPGVTAAMHILEGLRAVQNTRGRIIVIDRDKLIDLAGKAYQVAELEYERLASEI